MSEASVAQQAPLRLVRCLLRRPGLQLAEPVLMEVAAVPVALEVLALVPLAAVPGQGLELELQLELQASALRLEVFEPELLG